MKRYALICLWMAISAAAARGQTEGIFADFSTSKGAFTVWLDHSNAPRTVASFVGLATGASGWADPQGNVWHKPFYDRSLFHRVPKDANTNGIAIQGGGLPSLSVNTNTGVVTTNFANAGYYMLESTTNGLLHTNGSISLANSGPNTDGSQFFIMATNRASWDGSYSVFGHVTTGMNVVTSIAAVAVQGPWERPVQDVVLSNVVIRRVGAAAASFNIASQGVPVVESGPMRTFASGTNQMLVFDIANQSKMLLRETSDLQAWETDDWGYYTGASFVWTTSVARASLGDTYFFHMSRIRYPTPITTPANARARKFTFWWNSAPAVKYEARFATNWLTAGAYTVTTTNVVTGSIFFGETWVQNPYAVRLIFYDDSGKGYDYSLGFNPGQATNRFTGSWWVGSGAANPFSGVFTMQ